MLASGNQTDKRKWEAPQKPPALRTVFSTREKSLQNHYAFPVKYRNLKPILRQILCLALNSDSF